MVTRCLLAFCLLLSSQIFIASSDDKYDLLHGEWCGEDNCYEVLGVTAQQEFRDIKTRYNNLSLSLHPDKNPNQTEEDRALYVRINKAYEVLSSKRTDYDEFLRIKSSVDSPKESAIMVIVLLYAVTVGVVLLFQRQKQQQCKKAIFSTAEVIRYYWEAKQIDLTGKKKKKVKGKKAKMAQRRMKPGDVIDNTSVEEVNTLIKDLNLLVPGWMSSEPTWKQAAIDVPTYLLWLFGQLLFQVRWFVQYRILSQQYSDTDREYLCRKSHKKTLDEWHAIPDEDRVKLLSKPGPWKKKSKKE